MKHKHYMEEQRGIVTTLMKSSIKEKQNL